MAKKYYKSNEEQLKDYYTENQPTFVDFDSTKYNPSGVNEDKIMFNTESLKVLTFKFNGKKSGLTINFGDTHIGVPESQFKTRLGKLGFLIDYTNQYEDYVVSVHNQNDHENSGQLRDDRDRYHHTLTVQQMHETSRILIDALTDYIRGSVQANHEGWFDTLVGTNPILWNSISELLYSRGQLLIKSVYEDGSQELAMLTHEANRNAIKMATMYGVDYLYDAHTHAPKEMIMTYKHYNTKTKSYELKKLFINVAASSVPTSQYGLESNMKPVNTVGLLTETYSQNGSGIRKTAIINENGLYARANSLKLNQLKRVDEEMNKLTKDANTSIKNILTSPSKSLAEKINLMKYLKLELEQTKQDYILKHEQALKKENRQKAKRLIKSIKQQTSVDLNAKQPKELETKQEEAAQVEQTLNK